MKEPLSLPRSRTQPGPSPERVNAALAAGDYRAAVDVLCTIAEQFVQGEASLSVRTLSEWVAALPAPWRYEPRVRYIVAWLAFEQRRTTVALMTLEDLSLEFTARLGGPDQQQAMEWLAMIRMAQGAIFESEGRWERARWAFAEARRHLPSPPASSALRSTLEIDPAELERLQAVDRTGICPVISQAMALYQARGDQPGLARVAHSLGHLYLDMGEPAGARYWLEQALELKRGRPGPVPLSFTLDSLGICYRQLGMLTEAQDSLDEALRLASQAGIESVQASAMTHLGDVLCDRDEQDAALDLYRRSAALSEKLRNARGLAETQLSLSTLHRRAGRWGLAADCAAEARTLCHGQGGAMIAATADLYEQIAALLLGDTDAAGGLAETVDRLAELHASREEILGRWYLAVAAHRRDEPNEAAAHLRTALSRATRGRHLHMLAAELPVTAAVCRVIAGNGSNPDSLAGLVQRATPRGLLALLHAAPDLRGVVAGAGRLPEATSLSVSLLGTFRVLRAGQEIDLGAARSQKAVSLFKFLVAQRGRPVAREQIVEAIWPEADPDSADRSFEVTLSTLRRLVDPPQGVTLIVRRGRGYLLNPEVPLLLDVERFQRHLDRGKWWKQRGQDDLAVAEWERSEEAYGGDFLADDPYEDWATAERERLREQYLDLLLQLGEVALQQGRPADAVERAHRVLAADPIREAAYRLLMRAHALQGNRAVALRDLQRCSEVLRRELGEEPMLETRELARRIRSGESAGM
ncbi:MAG TPA: BTAD domain-containing putative transcriptional regulator [Symbiobacteriaceae bacterium]|nr:BTAD domain-containing putative transcriptional regulator [Symbiobacteriaceae bacterium]